MERNPQEVKQQYRAARRKRAAKGGRTARDSRAARPFPQPLRWLLGIGMLAAVCAGIVVVAMQVMQTQTDSSGITPLEPLDARGDAPEETLPATRTLPALAEVPPVVHDPDTLGPAPVPEEPVQDLRAPRGGWPEMSFTEAEVQVLDTLLEQWAASTPAVGSTADDSAGDADEDADGDATAATGHRVALYCKDIHSGAEYIYMGEEKFDVASLSKAPYAMWLYTLVEEGEAKLTDTLTVEASVVEASMENTGEIKKGTEFPKDYTLEELIYYLIRHSDTVAQRVLLTQYPAAAYAAWAAELGLHYPADVRGVTSGVISAVDAGVYLAALQDYMQEGEYGGKLREHMLNTSYPMIRSSYPVARKYGWDTAAYHDMAVVEAPHPYLLAVLTDKSAGTYEDLAMFGTVSQTIEQMLAQKWALVQLDDSNTRRWK